MVTTLQNIRDTVGAASCTSITEVELVRSLTQQKSFLKQCVGEYQKSDLTPNKGNRRAQGCKKTFSHIAGVSNLYFQDKA